MPELLVGQNEKRKDKDLTERIEKLLKRRDEVTRGIDLGMRHSDKSRVQALTYSIRSECRTCRRQNRTVQPLCLWNM